MNIQAQNIIGRFTTALPPKAACFIMVVTFLLAGCQAAGPALKRSEALKHTMLDLIDRLGYMDTNGRMVFSYAHPVFWAPFSLVGDGG